MLIVGYNDFSDLHTNLTGTRCDQLWRHKKTEEIYQLMQSNLRNVPQPALKQT
jgi:hypothetical protein